ncbi:MAG: deoxyguanosinetriphosphate triphosphohydrolase [Deltaproteobacteria bacterium]|nr:deoxyguanosinetriphosphate triphosphohydrolase [Deltaproteobacteria bacterium]
MTELEKISELEAERLAPYAVKSKETKGRAYKEDEHPFRTAFQRDRDRIIHSHAFRRLEYKTQVFVYHEGDHYRTRLTHTIEVAQIARTAARALGLNEDLAEAIALAHDLGHPPFGHTGERILDKLMKDEGGFEHNRHSLRIVEELETRYPGFRGLNLTWEVRESIIKHNSEHDKPAELEHFEIDKAPCLEAQIVDIADEIAYNNHDIDDGLSSMMMTPEALKEVSLWSEAMGEVEEAFPEAEFKVKKYQAVLRIINRQVTDMVNTVISTIEDEGIDSLAKVQNRDGNIARFSSEMEKKNIELKRFLHKNLYMHHRVLRMAGKAERILTALFEVYEKEPKTLPPHFVEEIERVGKKRVICDYMAGMTDRFALDEYKKLFDPYERV